LGTRSGLRDGLIGGTLFVSAIVFAVSCKNDVDALSYRATWLNCGNILDLSNCYRRLGFMPRIDQSILIRRIDHYVAEVDPLRDRRNLLPTIPASYLRVGVRTDELRGLNRIADPLIKNRPRILQSFVGSSALKKKSEIFGGRISAIGYVSNEADYCYSCSCIRGGIQNTTYRKVLGGGAVTRGTGSESERNESTLAYNVVRAHQISLVDGDTHNDGREYGITNRGLSRALYPLLAGAAFCFCAIRFYFISKGIDRDFDLLQTGAGCLFLFLALVALVIGIIHGDLVPPLFSISENASTAPGIDVSVTRYGGPEYVRIPPIVVPKLELRNLHRQVLFADLVKVPPHNCAFAGLAAGGWL